ncbi:sulfatase [soil metagenome]
MRFRSTFLHAWMGLLVALAVSAPGLTSAAEQRPNVLFIVIDDLNDWIGCLDGHPQVQTPHIDALARRGTNFTNAHCQTPLCNPTRTSFLTGLRPSTTGVYALNPWFRDADQWADLVTLPQHFAANGYRTLTTGKIYHDAYPPPEGRVDGTEFTVWGYHGSFQPRPKRKFVETPDRIPLMDWGVFPDHDEQQDEWKVADWAIEQIHKEATTDNPFFLSVGFRRPHVPCYATQRWFDLYPEETLELPPVLANDRDDTPRFSWYLHWKLPEPRLSWLEETGEWRPLVRAYLACISFVDSQVGRVLDALQESGQAENTIVIFTSDHGWHLGEKGITGKNTLWDPSTRVPLIFAGPGIAEGATCGRPAELLDIYPTLIDLCRLPEKPELEGLSLGPQLRDAEAARERPALTTHGPGNHGIRSEQYRYIRYADGSEELYDMNADPREWTNIADDPRHSATKQDLARWLPESDAAPLPGSRPRLIELKDGVPYWEGEPIHPDDPIP